MSPPIARIILYVKDIPTVAAFYQSHFGYTVLPGGDAGWRELAHSSGGCAIALHQAAKSQKSGAAMKIVFAVKDVQGFMANRERAGLKFGALHQAEGFEYANAKDPAGNFISISSRGLA